jgi:subtilisin family serine protease
MDVSRAAIICLISVSLLAGCAEEKTEQSVFPGDSNLEKTSQCASAAIKTRFIVQWENGKITTVTSENVERFKSTVLRPHLKDIAFVEYDQVVTIPTQSAVLTNSSDGSWGPAMMQANEAWAIGEKGAGIKVAVIDSGLDTGHPQLENQLDTNLGEVPSNGLDDDGNGYVDDVFGYDFFYDVGEVTPMTDHGTHVAGIVAADSSKGPVQGIAPSAKLIAMNFMGDNGGGSLGDAIAAMDYAVVRGANIVNASWGGAPCNESLKVAIKKLETNGILFVSASGNSGLDLDTYPEYPAAYNLPNQITVAASTESDRMAGFSNTSFSLVHVVAPGAGINSTLPGNLAGLMSGTSMATPMVSGAAAVVWDNIESLQKEE